MFLKNILVFAFLLSMIFLFSCSTDEYSEPKKQKEYKKVMAKYLYSDGVIDETPTEASFYKYNSDGKLYELKVEDHTGLGNHSVSKYSYDANGNLTNVSVFSGKEVVGTAVAITDIKYNSDNKPTSMQVSNAVAILLTDFEYSGKVVSKSYVHNVSKLGVKGVKLATTTYQYEKERILSAKTTGVTTVAVKYEYPDETTKVANKLYIYNDGNLEGTPSSTYDFDFDSLGNLLLAKKKEGAVTKFLYQTMFADEGTEIPPVNNDISQFANSN